MMVVVVEHHGCSDDSRGCNGCYGGGIELERKDGSHPRSMGGSGGLAGILRSR